MERITQNNQQSAYVPSSALDSDILLLREARIVRMNVRVMKTAVNMESNTPMARVTAKRAASIIWPTKASLSG